MTLAGMLLVAGCSSSERAEKDTLAKASLTVEETAPLRLAWPMQVAASGALKPWQEAVISAETGPLRIAMIHADVGSRVRQGAVLATLARDTVIADQAGLKAQLAEAQANLAKADSDVERARQVEASGALSRQQIQQYRVAQQTAQAVVASARAKLRSVEIRLGQTFVVAVDDGVVSSRSALLGKVVASGEELFRLVRQERIEWQAELDARQLALVKVGQVARVTLPDGGAVEGSVRLVSPTLDGDTSRGIVYVRLPAGSPAKAGMYGSGVIETGPGEVTTVPDTALFIRDGRSYVFLIQPDRRVKQQGVAAGQRRDGRVAVSGLPAGARVVKSGGPFLSDGVLVRIAGRSDTRR